MEIASRAAPHRKSLYSISSCVLPFIYFNLDIRYLYERWERATCTASRLTALVNDSLAEASLALEEIGQVLKPVIRTEPGDQLVENLFPNRKALEHATHLVSSLSDPGAQYEMLHMEDWNSDAYEKWLGKYGKPLPYHLDPASEGLESYMPVDCAHESSPPRLYGPPGGTRRERTVTAAGKQTEASEDESPSSSSSSESSGDEESDGLGTFFT